MQTYKQPNGFGRRSVFHHFGAALGDIQRIIVAAFASLPVGHFASLPVGHLVTHPPGVPTTYAALWCVTFVFPRLMLDVFEVRGALLLFSNVAAVNSSLRSNLGKGQFTYGEEDDRHNSICQFPLD